MRSGYNASYSMLWLSFSLLIYTTTYPNPVNLLHRIQFHVESGAFASNGGFYPDFTVSTYSPIAIA